MDEKMMAGRSTMAGRGEATSGCTRGNKGEGLGQVLVSPVSCTVVSATPEVLMAREIGRVCT